MLTLPESRFYRSLILFALIAGVLAYAWVASSLLEPSIQLPKAVIRQVAWFENGEARTLRDVMGPRSIEITRVQNDLDSIWQSLNVIGGMKHPIALLITADEPRRLRITENQIDIGSDLIGLTGQLKKSVLKAWLLQRATPRVGSSLLRLEVASDTLLAMLEGHLALESPGFTSDVVHTIQFPEIHSWMRFATSYRQICQSDWRLLELHALCGGQTETQDTVERISLLGFRPLLDAMIWQTYLNQPMSQRISYLRKYARNLVQAPIEPLGESIENPSVVWRDRIRAELEILLSSAQLPEIKTQLNDLRKAAGLDENTVVDFIFLSRTADEADPGAINRLTWSLSESRRPKTVLVEAKDGFVTLPGRALISKAELGKTKVEDLVWESCRAPSLKDVLHYSIDSERTLFVRSCGVAAFQAIYSPLMRDGVEAFARNNPDLPFLSLKQDPTRLAVTRKIVKTDSILTELMRRQPPTSVPLNELGLQNAEWNEKAQAFKVLGAVEAVEWFRTDAMTQ